MPSSPILASSALPCTRFATPLDSGIKTYPCGDTQLNACYGLSISTSFANLSTTDVICLQPGAYSVPMTESFNIPIGLTIQKLPGQGEDQIISLRPSAAVPKSSPLFNVFIPDDLSQLPSTPITTISGLFLVDFDFSYPGPTEASSGAAIFSADMTNLRAESVLHLENIYMVNNTINGWKNGVMAFTATEVNLYNIQFKSNSLRLVRLLFRPRLPPPFITPDLTYFLLFSKKMLMLALFAVNHAH